MPFHVHPNYFLYLFLLFLVLVLPFSSACRPSTDPEFKFILVSQEVAVEQGRFTFAILDRSDHPVDDARVSIEFLPPNDGPIHPAIDAVYRRIALDGPPVPDSEWFDPQVDVRGIYAVDNVPFDVPGEWQLRVSVQGRSQDSPVEVRAAVQVLPESRTPRIGEKVTAIHHRTASDVEDLSEISTSPTPYPEMYRTSISEALAEGKPFLVVFATPAFCQSRICGPVVETVARLLSIYAEAMEFIHIEPFDLDAIREGGELKPSREALAWGLPSEPWIFLIDASGLLQAKFEGIVTLAELEEAVKKTLGQG